MTTNQKIETIKQTGYDLSFGLAIEQVFGNYKKIALVAGAVIFVLFIAFFSMWSALVAVFFSAGDFARTMTNFEAESLTTAGIVINLLIGVISAAVIAPITAGILRIAHEAENHREFGFSMAFSYYRHKAFKEIFIAAIITTLSAQGIGMLLQMLGKSMENPSYAGWFTFASFLVSCFINLITLMVAPLIIFGDLKAGDAIKGSISLVLKKFWTILLLALVCFICAMLGIFGICIGIIFTFPVLNSFQYVLYRNAIGIDDESEMDLIGRNDY